MVSQYPYTLQVLLPGPDTQDAAGNIIPGTANWVNLTRCRDEDGRGKKVTLSDGNEHQFTFLIQMPKGVEALKAGTNVKVMEGSTVRAEGKVLYSRKGQMHTQTWV
jgi:hypothetical protein